MQTIVFVAHKKLILRHTLDELQQCHAERGCNRCDRSKRRTLPIALQEADIRSMKIGLECQFLLAQTPSLTNCF